jgi:predicted ribosome quality control (RQC) complex YloA/Tae2 family protein
MTRSRSLRRLRIDVKVAQFLLNWKEIDVILGELPLAGAIIRQAYQPKPEIIIFELYASQKTFSLFFSFSPVFGRIHTTTRKFVNPQKPQRFVSFLRAHIRDARIKSAEQVGKDRIVKFVVTKKEITLVIWVRLWGGASNMIVTDEEGNVLDACYRRPGRHEVSGGFYNPEKELETPKTMARRKDDYTVRVLGGEGSFNEKIEKYFFIEEEKSQKETLITSLHALFGERENYLGLSIEQAENKKNEYAQFMRYKELGDIISGDLSKIRKGDKWLSSIDYYSDNRPIDIELDTRLSPHENAQAYYDRYKKAKAGLERLEENLSLMKASLSSLIGKKPLLTHETDIEILKDLARDLRKKEKREISKADFPGLSFLDSGYEIFVGRTAIENDLLLRRYVRGGDFWFHCRDYPGAYVFIKSIRGKSLPLDVMLDAGNLALFYSKAKQSGKADVYYTMVKHLRRVKDAKKGLVIPTHEKNLYIVLDENRIEKLKNS